MSEMQSAYQSNFQYPLRLEVDYPTEPRNRLTALFRWLLIIPIFAVFVALGAGGGGGGGGRLNYTQPIGGDSRTSSGAPMSSFERWALDESVPGVPNIALVAGGAAGLALLIGPGIAVTFAGLWIAHLGGAIALMVLFREKYPRWWFEFTRELARFVVRIISYGALLRDEYPSTDEQQAIHLEIDPTDGGDLNRWMILVKWLLVIPHGLILLLLTPFVTLALYASWLCVVIIGRQPRFLFDFIVGTMRWSLRVGAYAAIYVTDDYPPFSFA
ncbi:MAG: DUF4389 domain-containing protein [Chloroflexi bacterium]|nr:MAG: DUF4389 domain-containing protein [Chloroflexota bacterium]